MPSPLKSLLHRLRRRRRSDMRGSSHQDITDHSSGSEDVQSSLTEQMEGLVLNESTDSKASNPDTSYQFGRSEVFAFDFKPTTTTTNWPGPAYDENARFAPGVFDKPRVLRPRGKLRAPKRKLSNHDSTLCPRYMKPPQDKVGSETGKHKALSRPIQYYGSPPRREEPLHLLTLPGEIRNYIYRILTVSRDPIIAQFKPIIRPHMGHPLEEDNHSIIVRRFPREPILALGNRQLRDEVLHTFYSRNKFLIRQTDNLDLKCHSLFLNGELEKWTPKWNMAASLMHLEIQFNARLLVGGKLTSNFVLRRSAHGVLRIEHQTEVEDYCMCFDERMQEFLRRTTVVEERESRHLVQEVGELIRTRSLRLSMDDGFVATGNKFRPKGLSCAECGKEHLRMLENGL